MRSLLFWLLGVLPLPLIAQTSAIKENLGPSVNTSEDQILPVFSLDGQTLYFSENGTNRRYEIWFSERDENGNWHPKQRAEDLNPPTNGSKYVFAQVENDLLLVNGWFEETANGLEQSKGLSWYVPSRKKYIQLDIPAIQAKAKGRFVNAFVHLPTKTLLLSYAEEERRDLYVCLPKNPSAKWTELRWQEPVKLPSPINTEYDDTTPFLDADGKTLYFASNRPGGYGQDDIYSAHRLDDSWANWSAPENLGFRVNSNFSEIYYCISPLQDSAYFVSYKHSYGSGDIFRFKMDPVEPLDSTELVDTDSIVDTTLIVSNIDSSDLIVATTPSEPQADTVEITELNVEEYKPNNLVFLIDRSASMRASSKLPLLKLSLKRLIGELRDIDQLTIMSFADSAILHYTTQGVTSKDSLYRLIDNFVADGRTKANRGLELAYDYTGRNFLDDGNNEIILVTDGQFSLSTQDRRRIETNERISLSVVGLGTDRNALTYLKKLAARGRGSFIRIRNAEKGTEALLEEVKVRSKR